MKKEFKVYQVSDSVENARYYMFTGLDMLQGMGLKVQLAHYEEVYSGEVEVLCNSTMEVLETIFHMLNVGREPEGYKGHSMSVSDIVLFDGKHYFCDDYGFELLEWNEKGVGGQPIYNPRKVREF